MPGPLTWENWVRWDEAALGSCAEATLWGDCHAIGEWVKPDCPYALLNALPVAARPDDNAPVCVIRAEFVELELKSDLSVTDESRFHGGNFFDEVAALL